jgi:hypothetical protein
LSFNPEDDGVIELNETSLAEIIMDDLYAAEIVLRANTIKDNVYK